MLQPAPSPAPQPAGQPVGQPAGQPAEATPAPKTPAAITPVARADEWWAARHASMNARTKQAAEQGDASLLFIGDSITQGWEGGGKDVWAKAFSPRGAINLGISGDRTQHVIWRLRNGNLDGLAKPKAGSPPKLAVVMIGTNNSGDDTPENITAGVTEVVKTLHDRVPATKVLVLAIFPRAEKADDPVRAKLATVNAALAKLADGQSVHFLDIGKAFLAGDGSLPKDVMPDFLHLSPKGYQLWADAIEPKLKELLGEK